MKSTLPDGLYEVGTKNLRAGFVVEDGEITVCAPILWNKIAYWQTVATRIEEKPKSLHYSNSYLRILSDAALVEQTKRCVESNCKVEQG